MLLNLFEGLCTVLMSVCEHSLQGIALRVCKRLCVRIHLCSGVCMWTEALFAFSFRKKKKWSTSVCCHDTRCDQTLSSFSLVLMLLMVNNFTFIFILKTYHPKPMQLLIIFHFFIYYFLLYFLWLIIGRF